MKSYFKILLFVATIITTANAFAGHGWNRVNHTNSTIFTGIVTVNGIPAESGDVIGIFVNGECRMISTIFNLDGTSYISAVLHGEKVDTATIKYWSAKQDKIYEVDTTIITSPSNEILDFPIKLKATVETTETKLVQTISPIVIYPTVAKASIAISTSKEIKSVTFIDNIGNTVLTTEELSNNKIDISSLSNGIYFVSVTCKDGSITTKKIIKN